MHHSIALLTSLASLGLICASFYCNILSRPESWLRSDMLEMILLALLTGFFPLAVVASIMGLWAVAAGGVSGAAVIASGVDLVSLGAVFATVLVFRKLVRATNRPVVGPDTGTPPSPGPVASRRDFHPERKAA